MYIHIYDKTFCVVSLILRWPLKTVVHQMVHMISYMIRYIIAIYLHFFKGTTGCEPWIPRDYQDIQTVNDRSLLVDMTKRFTWFILIAISAFFFQGNDFPVTARLPGYSIRGSNGSTLPPPENTCYQDPGGNTLPTIIQNDCEMTSQYVWIYQNNTLDGPCPILEICEVQVFGMSCWINQNLHRWYSVWKPDLRYESNFFFGWSRYQPKKGPKNYIHSFFGWYLDQI